MSALSDGLHRDSDRAAIPVGRSVIFGVAIPVIGSTWINCYLPLADESISEKPCAVVPHAGICAGSVG
jgi:hypothetical protein